MVFVHRAYFSACLAQIYSEYPHAVTSQRHKRQVIQCKVSLIKTQFPTTLQPTTTAFFSNLIQLLSIYFQNSDQFKECLAARAVYVLSLKLYGDYTVVFIGYMLPLQGNKTSDCTVLNMESHMKVKKREPFKSQSLNRILP